jgi:hypothetical protein
LKRHELYQKAALYYCAAKEFEKALECFKKGFSDPVLVIGLAQQENSDTLKWIQDEIVKARSMDTNEFDKGMLNLCHIYLEHCRNETFFNQKRQVLDI